MHRTVPNAELCLDPHIPSTLRAQPARICRVKATVKVGQKGVFCKSKGRPGYESGFHSISTPSVWVGGGFAPINARFVLFQWLCGRDVL